MEGESMAATRSDWKTTPLPAQRQAIALERTYSSEEFARLQEGYIPREMEDKWFSFYEEPWLYLHRSWTGYCVYQARFELTASGARPVEMLANRDPQQYRGTDERDALLLGLLLDGYAGRPTEDGWRRYHDSLRSG
jgi:hypothetical protein